MSDPFNDLEHRLRQGVRVASVTGSTEASSKAARAAGATPVRHWWRRLGRAPLVALALVAAGGGVAVAARALLLETGAQVPQSQRSGEPAPMTPSRPRVIVTVPDPVGGLDWGLAVFRRAGGHGYTCFFAGRTQAGQVGVIGQDGAFDDDGRFHPLGARSTKTMACGGGSPEFGQFVAGGSGPATPANGYSGDPNAVAAGRRVGGCTPWFERRTPGKPECTPDRMRHLKFGFAGGDAVRVTYGNRKVQRALIPPRGSAGAYLFVFAPGEGEGGGPKRLRITYADGDTCVEGSLRVARGRVISGEQCPRMPRTREPQTLLLP